MDAEDLLDELENVLDPNSEIKIYINSMETDLYIRSVGERDGQTVLFLGDPLTEDDYSVRAH